MPTNKTIREIRGQWDFLQRSGSPAEINDFLYTALLNQLEEIEEMVEGMKYKSDDLGGGWAVDAFDILLALKEKKSNLT